MVTGPLSFSDLIIAFLLGGIIIVAIGSNQNYDQVLECKIDNEKIVLKLEKDNVNWHAEKISLNEKFAKCEINCVSCQNDKDRLRDEYKIELDKCQTEARNTLAECQTKWSKAKENFERDSKGIILKLEKDNVTCHTEKRNSNENLAKCDEDRVSCKEEREILRIERATLKKEYTKCDTRYHLLIANEKKGNKQNISMLLEESEKDKKK